MPAVKWCASQEPRAFIPKSDTKCTSYCNYVMQLRSSMRTDAELEMTYLERLIKGETTQAKSELCFGERALK